MIVRKPIDRRLVEYSFNRKALSLYDNHNMNIVEGEHRVLLHWQSCLKNTIDTKDIESVIVNHLLFVNNLVEKGAIDGFSYLTEIVKTDNDHFVLSHFYQVERQPIKHWYNKFKQFFKKIL